MFLFDPQKTPVDDTLDIFVNSQDYVPTNKVPFQYTVKLNEMLTDISRLELTDRSFPSTSRYVFAIPVPSEQTRAQANACVPGIVYSAFDGTNLPRALIVRLGDFVPNTTSGATTQRLAYAVPFRGILNPAFSADVTNVTVLWNQPLVPSGSTFMTFTRGVGLGDLVYLRTERPPVQLKISFGTGTTFKHAMTPAVHHDTFWYMDAVDLTYPVNVNINRSLRRPINSDYMSLVFLVDGEPYIPPFDIVYGSDPIEVYYLPHHCHFRLYFSRKPA